MTMRASIALIYLGFAACVEPPPPAPPLVTCHNANCAYTDPDRDDTIDALRESLALEVDGRALIDGMELDFLWDGVSKRCVFEHDLANVAMAAPASEAVAIVADHLRTRGKQAVWNGERFIAKLELKAGTGPDLAAMSPADMIELADCSLEAADTLEAAARDAGLEATTLFISYDADLLLGLADRPRWQPARTGRGRARQLALPFEITDPRLIGSAGVLNLDYRHTRDGDVATYSRLHDEGVDVMVTAFELTESALAVIDYLAPPYINCNEAPIMRAWLDR